MRKVMKFTSGLLAMEPAATRLRQPVIPSEVLKMMLSWGSENGPAPLLPDPIRAGIGMASFARELSRALRGGIAAKIQDHCSGWKRKPWGGNNWQISVPMNKLPWISCYFNPSLLTEFSLWHQIDRFHHLRRNQNGYFLFFFLIFSYYCIQIHESKAESTLTSRCEY